MQGSLSKGKCCNYPKAWKTTAAARPADSLQPGLDATFLCERGSRFSSASPEAWQPTRRGEPRRGEASGPELASLWEPAGNAAVPTWLPPLQRLLLTASRCFVMAEISLRRANVNR